METLIFGAGGQDGYFLSELLNEKSIEVIGVSRTTTNIIGFNFTSKNTLAYKTLITQEMLNKGYLASTSVYTCTEHTPEIVEQFLAELDPIFNLIRQCEDGRNIDDLLNGPVCHSGFKRLN